nr:MULTISPECIES: hypothetical protein [unclassified Pseudonocardia]
MVAPSSSGAVVVSTSITTSPARLQAMPTPQSVLLDKRRVWWGSRVARCSQC